MRKILIVALLLSSTSVLSAQENITAPGTVPHVAAGTGFPEDVGRFRRSMVIRYGENDLSGNYDLRRGRGFMRLSVYIYPAAPQETEEARDQECLDERERVRTEIHRRYQNVDNEVVVSGDSVLINSGVTAERNWFMMHTLSFPLTSREPEVISTQTRIVCYVGGNWMVKYRISANMAFDVEQAIDSGVEFTNVGPWPGRAQ